MAEATSIRDKFAARFGEDQAALIEKAAEEHASDTNAGNRGSDHFKWALLICIGYQCIEVDSYRGHHGITAPWGEVKEWIKANADLGTHDGDCDYLSLVCGSYSEYVKGQPATTTPNGGES